MEETVAPKACFQEETEVLVEALYLLDRLPPKRAALVAEHLREHFENICPCCLQPIETP